MTPKQEKFCLAYIETGNATEAYRQAYNTAKMKPETINRKAKDLIDNGKIAARLAELRAPAIEAARLTLEGHLNDLELLREQARAAGQYSAAINAEIARGKAAGLYVEKREITGKNSAPIEIIDLSGRSTEELLAIVKTGAGNT